MMDDIAVYFEKYNLGNDRFVFKPVNIIRGSYDAKSEEFVTDCGIICELVTGEDPDSQDYFSCPTTMDELKKCFGEENSEEVLLTEYLSTCMQFCYIGYYDEVDYRLKIRKISFDDLEYSSENVEEVKGVFCDLAYLKDLRDTENLKELREKLDNVIRVLEGEEFNSNEYDEESNDFDIDEDEIENKYKAKLKLDKINSDKFNLKKLRKEVKDVIKGQDKAVDDVTRAIIINQMSENPRHKSHMLILGPSGTGKTEMINIISKRLGIPYFKADATAYTKEGYVGKSVYSMLAGLINACDGDIEKAQNGILIIDEIDKKLSSDRDWVSGKDVLNSLLKIMDRDVIEVDYGQGHMERQIMFDTSNLTIIFMGAFADLYSSKEIANKKGIGFGSREDVKEKEKITITNDDLIKAGMPPEFLGRIPIITNTEELSVDDLVEILYKSKGGAIDEEKEFCNSLGITLKYTSNYMREIAKQAHKTKTGARNLRKIVRESLAPAYDEILLDRKNIKVLKLNKQTALDNKKYYVE